MQVALLIDDEVDDHTFFRLAASKLSFFLKCESAYGGEHALSLLNGDANLVPHFIFIDMNMPLMNGMECLKRLKKLKKLSGAHIYMYSGNNPDSITGRCIRLGAEGVITKMSCIWLLKEALEETFAKHLTMAD